MEHSRTILIVDDNELVAKGLKTLLEHGGHTVHMAYSGLDALALVRAEHPDIVLLDIGLPDMSGYEVADTLRKEGGAALLLIAMSGYGAQDDKEKAFTAGFDHHLTKPVSIRDIEDIFAQ